MESVGGTETPTALDRLGGVGSTGDPTDERSGRMDSFNPSMRIEPIVLTDEATVVAQFEPLPEKDLSYQSEAALEKEFIAQLQRQAYEYVAFDSEAAMIANLRTQLEAFNHYAFTDSEWERFFAEKIAGRNEDVLDKTRRIQEDHVQVLIRDDGSTKNISLLDKQRIHNNRLQVTNQYVNDAGAHSNRYDVTVLVNGLPLVHIELKRRGVALREAFNQINRYQRDSFWAGAGLFGYVQIFVISNGTHTKYYSNTTRRDHITEDRGGRPQAKAATSDSFEFTSWWTDATNAQITRLEDFTRTFFAKHTLLAILTRYCVFTTGKQLLVMRPYQIAATEAILQRIRTSTIQKRTGTLDAGGYIWHTTGSGKTLTSFKTAKLAAGLEDVDKVLFVVDRKDLDHQTIKEYNRFAAGTVSQNQSTAQLARQINDPHVPIIVTTIQKLSNFVAAHRGHEIYSGHVVLIFDECHRSQFGDMHTAITKAFRNYHLFGFTGTPIFTENAGAGGNIHLRTTEQAFGDQLHSYTILNAVADRNVLPFRVDYIDTFHRTGEVDDAEVAGIDTEAVFRDPRRIAQIVSYIREHFDQKTKRQSSYTLGERRLRGFNSLLATQSIKFARDYYAEFRRQQADLPSDERLSVGIIYSYAPNAEAPGETLAEETVDPSALSADDRAFLEGAIADYNQTFETNHDTSANGFEAYYEDIARRLAQREIDLVIVVNMFLTGFDSKTLNTLWVDKNLRTHGLIQAFSRTNRILNAVKSYGNIVCFRNLKDEVDDAVALFGNKEGGGSFLIRPYSEYLGEYLEAVGELRDYPTDRLILSEEQQKAFITLFSKILRLRNILTSFDEFAGDDPLEPRVFDDYRGVYVDLWNEIRPRIDGDKELINDDLVFEIELVKQVEVNIDYIIRLVEERKAAYGDAKDVEIRADVTRIVNASPSLYSKRDLIEKFLETYTAGLDGGEQWTRILETAKREEIDRIISDERLAPERARAFVDKALEQGFVPEEGTEILSILPPMSRFARAQSGESRSAKKQRVVDLLEAYVARFLGA